MATLARRRTQACLLASTLNRTPDQVYKQFPASEAQDQLPTRRRGKGRPAPSQGLQRAARGLPGPGAGVGPTGAPADLGRRRPRLPEWQPQTERLLRATSHWPSPRPLPSPAGVSWSGVPQLFWEATMVGMIDWLY